MVIYVYYDDHPPAHVHAIYGECEVVLEIETGEVMRNLNDFPSRKLSRMKTWVFENRAELLVKWSQCRPGDV